jgi:nucleoside-diphosphate-sugar epimerase
MASPQIDVAVTGPTGTFGFGLLPLLEADPRIRTVVGVARRPFDPAEHGWTKLRYQQGDVREPDTLRRAFEGCDVVIHLAFLVSGAASAETMRAINIEGTVNAYRAAAEAGAERFVYASSVAAYGFHDDNPVPLTEEWPTRPDTRFAYAEEKAELEARLAEEAAHYEAMLSALDGVRVILDSACGFAINR